MSEKSIQRLIDAAVEIGLNDPSHREKGYASRLLIQCTMPHSKPEQNEYTRQNGVLTITMWSPKEVGLPYGPYPRLIKTWLESEVYKNRDGEYPRIVHPGSSFREFLDKVGVTVGGRQGLLLRQQAEKFFSTIMTAKVRDHKSGALSGSASITAQVASKYVLFWHKKNPDQKTLFKNFIEVSHEYFQEIVNHPVPLDLRILGELKRSALALDLYSWLTYRYHRLTREITIPWELLALQFGADYERKQDFKANVCKALNKISALYQSARFEVSEEGLKLMPSPTSIRGVHKNCG